MLLAGPILRRVDSKNVHVWFATDEGEQAVTEDTKVKMTLKEAANDITGTSSEMYNRIGKKLVIHLVSFEPLVPLQSGKVYAYDLKRKDISILASLMTAPALIGYAPDKPPSFVLPADDMKNLKVAHGSCRKMHGHGQEALSLLDEQIKTNLADPAKRIQQLFLTGDQVYADDIPRFGLWSITKKAQELISEKEDLPLPKLEIENENVREAKRIDPALATPGFRGGLLRSYAKMTTSDGGSHLLSFGEFCLGHLHAWSQDSWDPALIAAANSYENIDANWTDFKTKTGFSQEHYTSQEYLHPIPAKDFNERIALFKELEKEWAFGIAGELQQVKDFLAKLPAVRRVLANTPTYMIFDDHEISDDWNISMKWRNEVYSNSLGKSIIRNGLMAYALCQDLGNVPADYLKEGDKKKSLITEVISYAAATEFDKFNTATIDTLLGLTTPADQPQVTWHYHLNSGSKVKTLFLDTRNRRGFSALNSRPALLDENAFKAQFKFPDTPKADDSLFLISAFPPLGLSVFEDLIYPMATSIKGIASGDGSFASGQLIFDNESWYLNSKAYEMLLSQMSVFKKVVIFSGDIHYGFTTVLDYWKKEAAPSSRMIQLVSSSLKNLWKKNIRLFQSGFTQGIFSGFGGKLEKMGWTAAPKVEGVDISLVNRRRLREVPAVIDNVGVQKTVKITPEPDWRYRLTVPLDERTDDKIEHLRDEVKIAEASFDHKKREDIRRIAVRFTDDFSVARSKRLLYATHVCMVSFTETNLLHTFLYRSAEDPDKVLKMVHDVPLAATSVDEKKRPEFPVD